MQNISRVKLALDELRDMIDGGEECRGNDSRISHVIGILEGDANHILMAAKQESHQPDEKTIVEHIWQLFDQFQSPVIGNRSPSAEASARRKAKEVYDRLLPFLKAPKRTARRMACLNWQGIRSALLQIKRR